MPSIGFVREWPLCACLCVGCVGRILCEHSGLLIGLNWLPIGFRTTCADCDVVPLLCLCVGLLLCINSNRRRGPKPVLAAFVSVSLCVCLLCSVRARIDRDRIVTTTTTTTIFALLQLKCHLLSLFCCCKNVALLPENYSRTGYQVDGFRRKWCISSLNLILVLLECCFSVCVCTKNLHVF